jgi:hypothetical protein
MVHGNFHMENFTFFPQNVPTLGHLFPKKIFCKKSLDSSQPLFLLLPGGENSQQKKKKKNLAWKHKFVCFLQYKIICNYEIQKM